MEDETEDIVMIEDEEEEQQQQEGTKVERDDETETSDKKQQREWFFDGQDYYLPMSCPCGKPLSHFQRPLEECVTSAFEGLKHSKLARKTRLTWRIVEDKANDEGRKRYIMLLERTGEIERLCCKRLLLGLPIPLNIPRVIEDSDEEYGDDDDASEDERDSEFLSRTRSYVLFRPPRMGEDRVV